MVTSAVEGSPADLDFLAALLQLCDDRDAQLVVNPIRYRNPRTREEASEDDRRGEWWAPELEPYMLEGELRPHPQLLIKATKVQATAPDPLPARLSGLTKGASAVFGHPQVGMRCVANARRRRPAQLYTSGAVTRKTNAYSDTLAGELAEFHHSLAAVLVEICGDRFHLREIRWSPRHGGFIDLDDLYTPTGRQDAPRALGLVMGDIHVGKHSEDVMRATFGPRGIVERYDPEEILLHDLFDGASVNPHERGKALTSAIKSMLGESNLRGELIAVADWLNALPERQRITVVRSNHDDMLTRWLEHGKPEPENLKMYAGLTYLMLDDVEQGLPVRAPLEIALEGVLRRPVRWLQKNEDHFVGGVQVDQHGHRGVNGAKGNVRSFARIGARTATAHTHSPAIFQGCYVAGHSSVEDHGYNEGLSTWLNAHILINAFGYRTMLVMLGEHHRGD